MQQRMCVNKGIRNVPSMDATKAEAVAIYIAVNTPAKTKIAQIA
jgi:hypothetical protein